MSAISCRKVWLAYIKLPSNQAARIPFRYGNLLDMHLFQYYCASPLVNAVDPLLMATTRERTKA